MWAKGSPGATSPSKVRNTGRTGSSVRESVTIISVIACACGAMLVPAAQLVEHAAGGGGDRRGAAVLFARRLPGAASTTATARLGRACFSETAVARPT